MGMTITEKILKEWTGVVELRGGGFGLIEKFNAKGGGEERRLKRK